MSVDPEEQPIEYEEEQQQYRVLSTLAIASLVCAVLSFLTSLHWCLAILPVLGIVLGFLAARRISRAPKELTGRRLAQAGMILSVVFGVLGFGWQTYLRFAEVPAGYEPISYATLQPNPDVPGELIPPAAARLDGKRVFIKGYIDRSRQISSKQFVLCHKLPHCSTCAAFNKASEMIYVELLGELEAQDTNQQIRVGGVLHVVESTNYGGVPYHLRADYIR